MTVPDGTPDSTPSPPNFPDTASLKDLQSDEQRRVLDAVAQSRKCGLEGCLALPQLVVCGDQSAGKSSVLEALTGIPFPRNDNLCTRFPTEITLRYAAVERLCLRISPDGKRSTSEKNAIEAFSETIQDFNELPALVTKAMVPMGLDSEAPTSRGFARDVLSIEINGPKCPQLTLVDVPGLIQTESKGVTKKDIKLVEEITDFYIKQPRTICLPIVSASHDFSNQPILTKVREVDREGDRTLGIITKPDRLDHGSGLEASFKSLARNENIFFKLGWHIVKNRSFEESLFSIDERNRSEEDYFRQSHFCGLAPDCCGVETLRARLSGLLFEHIKRELPNLRRDIDNALAENTSQIDALGSHRATAQDCRNYLTSLSLTCMEVIRSAVNGHYEGNYFQLTKTDKFDIDSPESVRRFRAVIQLVNKNFADTLLHEGCKYRITTDTSESSPSSSNFQAQPPGLFGAPPPPPPKWPDAKEPGLFTFKKPGQSESSEEKEHDTFDPLWRSSGRKTPRTSRVPIAVRRAQALEWVKRAWVRSRGKEPFGNYNPLIIGELFWEQSSSWRDLAKEHVDRVSKICTTFLNTLLQEKCTRDVQQRLSALKISEAVNSRQVKAMEELERIIEDNHDFPVVYNRQYITNVQASRAKRTEHALKDSVKWATRNHEVQDVKPKHMPNTIDEEALARMVHVKIDPDMEYYGCEEALDYLMSMYDDKLNVFIANVTCQVIERNMVRGLDKIFTPLDVNGLSDDGVLKMASEPASTKRERDYLLDRRNKLHKARDIFKNASGNV